MSRKYRFTRSGFCPTQNEDETIEIRTTEYRMLGNNSPSYKKTGFYCDYANSRYCEISNDCPIYLESPDDPHLA